MVVSKKLTCKSGITIPKHVRAEAGFTPNMAVDIETASDGILIRKRVPTCRFCGQVKNVITACGLELCIDCAKELVKEVQQYGI